MLQGSEAAAKFIDTVIDTKLQGTNIESDVRATLHKNLLQRLENQITYDIISLLNNQEQLELEHLVDTNQLDRIEGYLTGHGVDLNRVVANAMLEFKASYLGA